MYVLGLETAQWLRALVGTPEDPGGNTKHPHGNSQWSATSVPEEMPICASKIPIYIKLKKSFFKKVCANVASEVTKISGGGSLKSLWCCI